MKIAVINPASKFSKNVVRDVIYGCWCKGKRIGGGSVLPYWLILVSTVLKEAGNQVSYLDLSTGIDFKPEDYRVIILNTSSMSFNEDVEFLAFCKQKNPGLITIMFGSHPHYMPLYCLEASEIDVIVRGEPDFVIKDLIKLIEEGRDYSGLPGIGFVRDGRKQINPDYPYIENLDVLPVLDDSFIPDTLYFNPLIIRYPYISLITSRGCPGKCTFCPASSFYGSRYRWQSPERVIREMEHFADKGYKEVYFRDETFTFNIKRIHEICNLILKKGIKMKWICNARIGNLDKESIGLMKKAGCHWIKFGIESGSQAVLDNIKKGIKIEEIRTTFKYLKEIGMDSHAHFMIGLPGDDQDSVDATISFAKEIGPTTASFGICTPYPGTELFESVAEKYPEIKDGTKVDFSSLHTQGYFNEEFTSIKKNDLNKLIIKAYRAFYLRPLYILSWIFKIRTVYDIRRISIAGAKILDFVFRGD